MTNKGDCLWEVSSTRRECNVDKALDDAPGEHDPPDNDGTVEKGPIPFSKPKLKPIRKPPKKSVAKKSAKKAANKKAAKKTAKKRR